jgi:hypothetical protein
MKEYERIEITGHQITFIVHGETNETIGGLFLLPMVLEGRNIENWRSSLVTTKICFRCYDSVFELTDYFSSGQYLQLRDKLMELRNGDSLFYETGTAEPGFDLAVTLNTVMQDITFQCYFPSRSAYDRSLDPHPESYRRFIIHRDIYEFTLEKEQLENPITQLNALIDFIRAKW